MESKNPVARIFRVSDEDSVCANRHLDAVVVASSTPRAFDPFNRPSVEIGHLWTSRYSRKITGTSTALTEVPKDQVFTLGDRRRPTVVGTGQDECKCRSRDGL